MYDSPEAADSRQRASATEANKIKAISYAAYCVKVDLFPAYQASLGFDPNDTSMDPTTALATVSPRPCWRRAIMIAEGPLWSGQASHHSSQ
ncbi:MAG TPA: hypothetical protein VEK34_02115 [Methylocella sp.]|nr:hypothetical protein [Methylocella sp.]